MEKVYIEKAGNLTKEGNKAIKEVCEMEKENKSLSSKILKNIIEKASTPEKDKAMWLDRDKTLKAINEKMKEFIKDIMKISEEENVYRALTREAFIKSFNKRIEERAGKELI